MLISIYKIFVTGVTPFKHFIRDLVEVGTGFIITNRFYQNLKNRNRLYSGYIKISFIGLTGYIKPGLIDQTGYIKRIVINLLN